MTFIIGIGTEKGLFLASSSDRRNWEVRGPVAMEPDGFTNTSEIYALGFNPHTKRLLVGAASSHFGPSVWHSDDAGQTWHEPEAAPIAFPQDLPYRKHGFPGEAQFDMPDSDEKNTLTRVWQLAFGVDPNRVYAGVEPTALFVSDDGGSTFELNRAMWNHPTRDTWASGGGGPAIHTVVADRSDPDQVTIAMSSGGVYQTDDGGRSWTAAGRGIPFDYGPVPEPVSGQCVHKLVRDADGRYYAQNHGGVLASEDPQSGWHSIADGLPTDFGFAMLAHPSRPGTVYQFPVVAAEHRFPPEDRIQVRRTEDGGKTWSDYSAGLPESPYFGIVLRDAAGIDMHPEDPGFYFGTRTGDVFARADSADEWVQVAAHLPDVLCVRAAEV